MLSPSQLRPQRRRGLRRTPLPISISAAWAALALLLAVLAGFCLTEAAVSPSPTPSLSKSPSTSSSASASQAPSSSVTASSSSTPVSASTTATASLTATVSASYTATSTGSPVVAASQTPSASLSASLTASAFASGTASASIPASTSTSPSASVSRPASPSASRSTSRSPSASATRYVSPSVSRAASATPSRSSTVAATLAASASSSTSATPSQTASASASGTASVAATASPSSSVRPHVEVALSVVAPAGIASPCAFYTREGIARMVAAIKCDLAEIGGVKAENVLLKGYDSHGCANIALSSEQLQSASGLNSNACGALKAAAASSGLGRLLEEGDIRRLQSAPSSALFFISYDLFVEPEDAVVASVPAGQDAVAFVSAALGKALQAGTLPIASSTWQAVSGGAVVTAASTFQVNSISTYGSVPAANPPPAPEPSTQGKALATALGVTVPLALIGAAVISVYVVRARMGKSKQAALQSKKEPASDLLSGCRSLPPVSVPTSPSASGTQKGSAAAPSPVKAARFIPNPAVASTKHESSGLSVPVADVVATPEPTQEEQWHLVLAPVVPALVGAVGSSLPVSAVVAAPPEPVEPRPRTASTIAVSIRSLPPSFPPISPTRPSRSPVSGSRETHAHRSEEGDPTMQ